MNDLQRAKLSAARRFQPVTPYRLGLEVARLKLDCENPYRPGSLGHSLFARGVAALSEQDA